MSPLQSHKCSRHSQPAAYTLVELLIVIMIAILLMVVSLPVAKSVMEDARPREASRIFNSTIVAVKARAAQSDRLAGIELVMERMNDPMAPQAVYQCTQMFMCEVPPLYMGDTTTAVATVDINSATNATPPALPLYNLVFQDRVPFPLTMPPNTSSDSTTATMNHLANQPSATMLPATTPGPEDVFEIRFNHRGPWYPAQRGPMANQFQITLGTVYPVSASSYFNTNNYHYSPFQVRRPPQRVGNAVELPRSTTIDATYSGVGPTSDMIFPTSPPNLGVGPSGMEFATAQALRVMFAPGGNVHSMTMAYQTPGATPGQLTRLSISPLGTIHFLIGLTSKTNPIQDPMSGPWNFNNPDRSNLADGNALWVSISRTTGVVTTNENNPDLTLVSDPTNAMQRSAFVANCRRFATAREQKGGR